MIRLYINNEQADIWSEDKLNLSINYSINEMRKLSSRKGSTTKTIDIPATPTNKRLLGFQEVPSSITVMNNSFISARVQDGGTVLIDGFLKFTSANELSYQIVIIGDNGDWASRFKQSNINELDYSDQDHIYDETTIADSWTIESGRVYTYPFIDYGITKRARDAGAPSTVLSVEDFKPALQVGDMITRMYNNVGYTVESDFIDNTLSNYYMPFSNERLMGDNDFINDNQWTASNSTTQSVSWGANSFADIALDLDTITADASVATIFDGGYIQSATVGKMKVKIELDITNTGSNEQIFQVKFFKNAVGQTGTNLSYITSNSITLAASDRGSLTLVTSNYLDYDLESVVKPGYDLIWFEISKRISNTAAATINSVTITNEVIPDLLEGQTVAFDDNLPDINQLDFISDIKVLFNLYFRTDSNTKKVYIEPRDTLYGDIANAVDWTSKRDLSKGINIEYLNQNVPKELKYTYSSDSDDYKVKKLNEDNNFILGENTYTFDNIFSTDKGSTSIKTFAPTLMNTNDPDANQLSRFGFTPICPVLHKGQSNLGAIPDFTTKFKSRILYYNGLIDVATGQKFNFEGTLRTGYPQCYSYNDVDDNDNSLLFADLTTGWGLMNRYYLNENQTLNEGKLVTMYFNINSSDINLLDLTKAVKVKNDYYYINKISDYNPLVNSSTKVELITIVESGKSIAKENVRDTFNNINVTGTNNGNNTLSLGYDSDGNINIYNHIGQSALTINKQFGNISTYSAEGMYTYVDGLLTPLFTEIDSEPIRLQTNNI